MDPVSMITMNAMYYSDQSCPRSGMKNALTVPSVMFPATVFQFKQIGMIDPMTPPIWKILREGPVCRYISLLVPQETNLRPKQ